jgi:hypothetical protein
VQIREREMCNFSHNQNNELAMRLSELSELIPLGGGGVNRIKVNDKASPILN